MLPGEVEAVFGVNRLRCRGLWRGRKEEEAREGLKLHGNGDGVVELDARNVDRENIEIETFGP